MAIPITCAGCGEKYRLRDGDAGRRVKCRICGQRIQVPEPMESEGQILRHAQRERGFQLAAADTKSMEAICEHFKQHVGDVESVFHEPVSDLIHLDVHFIPATDDRPYHTLFTTGMSDLPMMVPEESGASPFAELLVCLPPDWPLSELGNKQAQNQWPVRLLQKLAHYPHEYATWLGAGHTIPNGNPPRPFSGNTGFCCAMLLSPTIGSEGFAELTISPDKVVHFFSMFVLLPDEVEFKLKKGAEALEALFLEHGVTELVDNGRRSVCKKRGK